MIVEAKCISLPFFKIWVTKKLDPFIAILKASLDLLCNNYNKEFC